MINVRKWTKRAGLVSALMLLAFVAIEGRYWPFWYIAGQRLFVDMQSQSLANALESRVPTQSVAGDSKDLPGNHSTAKEQYFAEAIAYAEESTRDSLLIWHSGELLLEKYWNDLDRDFRPETASMHKSVLGLLFAIAWDEGLIQPEDKIGQYLPEWRDDSRGNITIEQLLTMSSGLETLSLEGGLFSPAKGLLMGRKSREIVTSMSQKLEPGTEFWYQNAVSQLAGYVLAAATGERYTDYLSEKLWKPIGADEAFVNPERSNADTPRTYSSLFARPYDWLKLGVLILQQGQFSGQQVISRQALDRVLMSSKTNPNYGWQIWLGREWQDSRYYNVAKKGVYVPMSEPFDVDDIVFFDGFGGQRVYVSRSLDVVIVTTGQVNMDMDDSVFPNVIARAIRNANENSTDE